MKRLFGSVCLVFSVCLISIAARAGDYFDDFGSYAVATTTNFARGAKLFSTGLGTTASVVDSTYKELQLTANGINNARSAFLLPDLDAGSAVYAFSAKWNAEINGAFPNAADGYSFNFGQLGGLDLINPSGSQESGYSTGICFSVQTYYGNQPGFYLRCNGNTLASQPYSSGPQWGTNNTTRHFSKWTGTIQTASPFVWMAKRFSRTLCPTVLFRKRAINLPGRREPAGSTKRCGWITSS